MMKKPRALRPGDAVRVLAPASPFDRARLPDGLAVLKEFSLVPVFSERIFESDGYLAGPDSLRARELIAAFTTDACAAVMPVRGGYGSMRLLRDLKAHSKSFEPRLFIGFSDITALHRFFQVDVGLVTFHGPNVISSARLDPESRARLRATLFGENPEQTFLYAGLQPLVSGRARGPLVVGNLSLITSLIGTPWAARLPGSLLVLEDVSEPLYRVDRMLCQLSMQPDFEAVAGLAFGDLGVPEAERDALAARLGDFAQAHRKPAVCGFPIGHGERNVPVPQSVTAILDADVGVLRVLESPYSDA